MNALRGGAVAWLAVVFGVLGFAPAAQASPLQRSIFIDDTRLLNLGPITSERTLDELRSLGADAVRVIVPWRGIAPGEGRERRPPSLSRPSDPALYPRRAWDRFDHLVVAATARDIDVMLSVTGGAPLWATGRRNGRRVSPQYLPSPRQYGAFLTAVGRRYSGRYRDENQGRRLLPRVRIWSVWNEPNQRSQLQPQFRRDPRTGRIAPYSPYWYRRLYRAAVAGLAAGGHGGDTILLGETAPLGNSRPGLRRQIRPLLFLRELFCLDGSSAPKGAGRDRPCDFAARGRLPAAGYAHHPYSVKSPPGAGGAEPDEALLGDTAKLAALLDAAAAAGRIDVGLPLWYTEYGYQTLPPDPFRGISFEQQSEWVADAEMLTWAEPRVAAMTQFLLVDSAPRVKHPVGSRDYWSSYQSGLRLADGTAKLAYRSYRLPFVAPSGPVPFGGQATFWGMARPGRNGSRQIVRLEFRSDGSGDYASVGEPFTVGDARGYFTTARIVLFSGNWRFSWRDPDSGAWIASPSRHVSVG